MKEHCHFRFKTGLYQAEPGPTSSSPSTSNLFQSGPPSSDCNDACPTDMSTVKTLLHQSVGIARTVMLWIILVDYVVWCRAKTIRWQIKKFNGRLMPQLYSEWPTFK